MTNSPQLAWIGLRNMGRGMCKNLVEKADLGHPLILYNRSSECAQDFSKQLPEGKSTVEDNMLRAVAHSDIIFTCVGDDKAMLDIYDDLSKNCELVGKLLVDCSTVHPDTTAALAKIAEAKEATFVACPVFGAPAMAEAGQLLCVLAGSTADVELVKPYTTGVMARAIIDFSGEPPSKATLLKVIGNTFVLSMVETLAEGHVIAEKSGLGVENLQRFLEIMFPGPYMAYSKRLSSGEYYNRPEPLFSAVLARKDARHALGIARASGVHMKMVELTDGHLEAVEKHAGSKGDVAGIYGAVRQESGLKYENLKVSPSR